MMLKWNVNIFLSSCSEASGSPDIQLFWEGFPQGLSVCLWEFLTILSEVIRADPAHSFHSNSSFEMGWSEMHW